jgi:hypothetical protein
LVIGEGALWAAGRRQGTLLRLDLATHELTTIPAENWNGLAVGDGAVWVARVSPGDEEDRYYGDPRLLVRIDAATSQVVGRPVTLEGGHPDPVGGASGPFATGDGGVWLIGDGVDGGLVVAWLDSQRLGVESSVALTEWPYTDAILDADAGVIWVSHAYSVTRVDVRA